MPKDPTEKRFCELAMSLGINHSIGLIMEQYNLIDILEACKEECLNYALSDKANKTQLWENRAEAIKRTISDLE